MGKKNNRMGSGLADLFADNTIDIEKDGKEEKSEEKASGGITMVRLSLLEPNKDQPRGLFDDEKLEELAESIRENGVLQPILVRPLDNGGYQIVAGERRWRASRLAGLTEVPVYIKELDDKQTMQVALIENIQRQDLTPIEEAMAYQNIMDKYGMTQEQIAKIVGKSRSAVANSLRLLNLCDEVREWVNEGSISAGHAKVLAGVDPQRQYLMGLTVKAGDISVRQLEEAVRNGNEYRARGGDKLIPEVKNIREHSFKAERPFLKEFEVSVNDNSNIRAKAKSESNGGAKVVLEIGRELDIEAVLSKLAEILAQF